MNWTAPYLPYEDIKLKAEEFLSKYHPSRSLPIPIEDIVELGLRLNIVPFPGLYYHGVNGFLSRDRTEIWVDEYQFEHYQKKCRFTLAYEVGHYVLHTDLYKLADPANDELANLGAIEKYIKWLCSIPKSEVGWFETHAKNFAGLVLVPSPELETECRRVASAYSKALREKFKGSRIPPEDAWPFMADEIAKVFDVNPLVVEIRIRIENIAQRIPLP